MVRGVIPYSFVCAHITHFCSIFLLADLHIIQTKSYHDRRSYSHLDPNGDIHFGEGALLPRLLSLVLN